MRKKILTMILISILAIVNIGCTKEDTNQPISRTEIFMGTPISIRLYDGGNQKALDKAFEKIVEIEDSVSINKKNTEITKLNESAGIEKVKLSDISYDILKKGIEYSRLSNGTYDITIGPLVKLWSIGLEDARVPSQDEINNTIDYIDYNNIEINNATKEAFLIKKGMEIDLGSIAKGYAADEVAKILKQEGVNSAIIDLGGNIYALGSKSSDSNWKVGIQNPFNDRGEVVGSIEVSDKTVVTSGIYERFIEEGGVKYHHILNPKTGYPYETDIAGVSIIADNSIDADALSTLTFTKGLEEGLKFVEDLENVDAIFITNDKQIYMSEGIKENFKLIDNDFKISN
ncbi:FAD:protein FMN transferase [Romboutsia ilealis]|uniref:FAD:protein FMN transferase n=1 Tax=Romboutsia ilealis TaxID=1115758 RepID=UPI002574725D|nr:FAD:protein FMN transferase [Romboutsia ilealis]